jgi:hypothetical protein
MLPPFFGGSHCQLGYIRPSSGAASPKFVVASWQSIVPSDAETFGHTPKGILRGPGYTGIELEQ